MFPIYALSTALMIGYASVFTLLAEMRNAFGFNELAIGALAGSAFVAGFVAQLSLSTFADRGHGQRLLQLGLVVAIAGALWMCFAESLWSWLVARMLLGFGAGCVRPAARRLAFVLNPEKAGETLGRLAAWEMVGFLIGPVLASVLFSFMGIRAPFIMLTALLILLLPWVIKVTIPGAPDPLPRAMLTLLRRPAMQSTLALGVAFYMAIGVFDAIWAVFMADMGASQLFIGVTMSLFTIPMILIAPWAGRLAGRRNVLNLVTVTMAGALLAMLCYGYIDSIWWMLLPLGVHATMDAMSMPATQLAVGYASGDNALAAGQGLFGAMGLVVAAVASLASGALYLSWGPTALWLAGAATMAVCLVFAQLRGRSLAWQAVTEPQSPRE